MVPLSPQCLAMPLRPQKLRLRYHREDQSFLGYRRTELQLWRWLPASHLIVHSVSRKIFVFFYFWCSWSINLWACIFRHEIQTLTSSSLLRKSSKCFELSTLFRRSVLKCTRRWSSLSRFTLSRNLYFRSCWGLPSSTSLLTSLWSVEWLFFVVRLPAITTVKLMALCLHWREVPYIFKNWFWIRVVPLIAKIWMMMSEKLKGRKRKV